MFQFQREIGDQHQLTAAVAPSHVPSSKTFLDAVRRVSRSDTEGIFGFPLNVESLPNYSEIIDTPLDLCTIGCNALLGNYPSLRHLVDDLELMCLNCALYNGPHEFYVPQAFATLTHVDAIEYRVERSESLIVAVAISMLQRDGNDIFRAEPLQIGLPLSQIETVDSCELTFLHLRKLLRHCAAWGAHQSERDAKLKAATAMRVIKTSLQRAEDFVVGHSMATNLREPDAKLLRVIDEVMKLDSANLLTFPRWDSGSDEPSIWLSRCRVLHQSTVDPWFTFRKDLDELADFYVRVYGPESQKAGVATKMVSTFAALSRK